jgi:hypothetical protein
MADNVPTGVWSGSDATDRLRAAIEQLTRVMTWLIVATVSLAVVQLGIALADFFAK